MDASPQINTGTDLGALASSLNGKQMSEATYQKGEASLIKESEKIRKEEKSILLSTPPKLTEAPDQKDYTANPMQTFGSFGMVLASLGSLMTRHPMTSALNSGAEVFKAKNAGDAAGYKNAMDKWKVDSENAWKMADWDQKNFENMRNKYKDDLEGLNREAELWAAATKNPALDAAVKAGQVQEYFDNHQKAVQGALDAKEEKEKKNGVLQGLQEEWLDKHLNPDGSRKTLKEIPKADAYKITENAENEWKQVKEGKLGGKDGGGILSDEKYQAYKSDPSMTPALKAYMHSGSLSVALGASGGRAGNSYQEKAAALRRMAQEQDPDFDPAMAQFKYAGYKKELATVETQNGKISLASNILDSSIPSLIDSAKKLNLGPSTSINALYNAAKKQFNSSDFKNFSTQLRAATTDYAQFIGRGQGTVHSDEESLKILNENMNTSSLEGFKDAVSVERANVQKGIDDTIDSIDSKVNGKPSKSASSGGGEAPDGTVITDAKGKEHTKKDGKWNPPMDQ